MGVSIPVISREHNLKADFDVFPPWDKVLLCSPSSPGTRYVDLASLELTENQGLKACATMVGFK